MGKHKITLNKKQNTKHTISRFLLFQFLQCYAYLISAPCFPLCSMTVSDGQAHRQPRKNHQNRHPSRKNGRSRDLGPHTIQKKRTLHCGQLFSVCDHFSTSWLFRSGEVWLDPTSALGLQRTRNGKYGCNYPSLPPATGGKNCQTTVIPGPCDLFCRIRSHQQLSETNLSVICLVKKTCGFFQVRYTRKHHLRVAAQR